MQKKKPKAISVAGYFRDFSQQIAGAARYFVLLFFFVKFQEEGTLKCLGTSVNNLG